MEKENEFIDQVGESVLSVLTNDGKGGEMKKRDIKILATNLGDECRAVYHEKEEMPRFENLPVLEEILDKWIEKRATAPAFVTRKDRLEYFLNILEKKVKRPDLAVKIKKKESSVKSEEMELRTETDEKPNHENSLQPNQPAVASKFIKHDWTIEPKKQTPGTKATVDDQGMTELCTSYAVAKAIIDGFDQGIWTNGKRMDVSESTDQLVEKRMSKVHHDRSIWPSTFHGKTIDVPVKCEQGGNKMYHITFETETCIPKRNENSEKIVPFNKGDYPVPIFGVLVKEMDVRNYQLHSLYCKEYQPELREFNCINSWGPKESYPVVKDDDASIKLLELLHAVVKES